MLAFFCENQSIIAPASHHFSTLYSNRCFMNSSLVNSLFAALVILYVITVITKL